MKNKIRKNIEKICLVGTITGASLIFYGVLSDKQNIANYGVILNTPTFLTYLLLPKKRNELENTKKY